MSDFTNDGLTATLSNGTGSVAIHMALDNADTENSKEMDMSLPVGSEIIDQDGNVVATTSTGVNKSKIRVPKRE